MNRNFIITILVNFGIIILSLLISVNKLPLNNSIQVGGSDATHAIDILNDGEVLPQRLEINKGEPITWFNNAGTTVTIEIRESPDGTGNPELPHDGFINPEQKLEFKFTSIGEYKYKVNTEGTEATSDGMDEDPSFGIIIVK